MGLAHSSTAAERMQWASEMLAHQGQYGFVTRLSHQAHVSRRTLYVWRDQAAAALRTAFAPPAQEELLSTNPRHLLTLWINHASDRGIQHALRECTQRSVSLATITALLHQAGQRALHWMHTHLPPTSRALALDEIYQNNRRGAYFNVVDVHSGAVWTSEGPLPVDCESWTLLLWELQDRGLRWDRVVLDGGLAMHAACQDVTPAVVCQGDIWHELHTFSQVQARLDRTVSQLEHQSPVVARQAARIACGKRPLGRKPKSDLAAHAHELARARSVAEGSRYLSKELRTLLQAVVVRPE